MIYCGKIYRSVFNKVDMIDLSQLISYLKQTANWIEL